MIIDGNFDFPQEIEGTGIVSVDEITRAKIVTRKYCVVRSLYNPLLQGTFQAIPDYQYPTCILIEERPDSSPGQMLFFTRVFAEIPATRTEPRMVAFPVPGRSAATFSLQTGKAINWKQYGNGSPYVRAILGKSTFSYAAGDPITIFSPPALTTIFYTPPHTGKGQVDFIGPVYDFTGTRGIYASGQLTQAGAEPSFTYVGSTDPAVMPNPWIFEANISRWRGGIWVMEVTTVATS
jgi:hypothetical protein